MTTLSQGPVPYYIGATWGIPPALHDILEVPLGEQACLLEPYLALANDVTMTCLPTSARKQAYTVLEQARLELLRRELNADLVADLLRPLFLGALRSLASTADRRPPLAVESCVPLALAAWHAHYAEGDLSDFGRSQVAIST
eukprot:505788-Amphidinium_carterae.1